MPSKWRTKFGAKLAIYMVDDIKERMRMLQFCRIEHVKSDANSTTHVLARKLLSVS